MTPTLTANRDEIVRIGRRGLVWQKKDILEALTRFICIKYDMIPYNFIIHFDSDEAHCNPRDKEIVIGEDYSEFKIFDNHVGDYVNVNLLSEFGKVLWTLFHELGHAIQYERHYQWYLKNLRSKRFSYGRDCDYSQCIDNPHEFLNAKYREYKLESNADKIATCLMNKYYPELIEKKIIQYV